MLSEDQNNLYSMSNEKIDLEKSVVDRGRLPRYRLINWESCNLYIAWLFEKEWIRARIKAQSQTDSLSVIDYQNTFSAKGVLYEKSCSSNGYRI